MPKYSIRFSNITKTYKNDLRLKKTIVLTDLSFHVKKGEVFGIVGPNGAGKSTTLKILMGFVKPDKGEVLLAEKPPSDPSSRSRVGYLPENPCLYNNLTAREHLEFAAQLSDLPRDRAQERIEQVLELVELTHAARLPVRKYSKGMVQRAALAYALFHEPEILILDEPMSGLDPLGRKLVVDIVKDYNKQGNTILFCSHILTDVERICDRIAIMNRGRILTTVTPEELDGANGNGLTPMEISPLESLFVEQISSDRR